MVSSHGQLPDKGFSKREEASSTLSYPEAASAVARTDDMLFGRDKNLWELPWREYCGILVLINKI